MVTHHPGQQRQRPSELELSPRDVPTCALHKDLIDTEEDLSCFSGTHARASGIIFFTHTQSQLMSLYSSSQAKPSEFQQHVRGGGLRCGEAATLGSGRARRRQQQPALVPRAHKHTHTQTNTHIYIYIKKSMSDATSSTMLVSHHRYFIAHSLVSLFFVNKQWSTPNTHATYFF